MNPGVLDISLPGVALSFLPVLVVLAILYRWSGGAGTATYALGRMLLQLALIGYVLNYLFAADQGWIVILMLAVMLFAVGLVSLPGMMTGQMLSGIEPLVAARYQVVVMTMLFGSSGIAAACYLWLAARARKPD